MKRNVMSCLVLVFMFFAMNTCGFASAAPVDAAALPVRVQLNGSIVNAPYYMSVIEGQVMVPLRWSAGVLGGASVEWDAAARTVTITTPQDFYSMEKLRAYVGALQSPIDEYNNQIWPLPDKARNLELPDLVSNRQWVLNLEQFKSEREGLTLPAPRDNITINITSDDGVYEHSSVVNSIENRQGHYYLPMDWLEYLFNARFSYNEATNILSIQAPDLEQIRSEIERIENALIPDSADEAIKLWGRGLQTRNGALQYAALSPQLRQEADKSAYVRQSYWVIGSSSPQVGSITIASRNELSDTKIEYTLSFPEIFSGQPHAIATEKMLVEKLFDNVQGGWFITQILQSSGYGIIEDETTSTPDFYQSVKYDPSQDLLSFTIPETIPEGKFYLHVSGRKYMGDKSNGMSWHAFDEETQNYSWESGKTYTHSLNSENLDECVLVFGLIDMNNQELLYTIHISPDGTKKLANSEKLLSFIEAYDEKTRILTFDEVEWVMQTDTKRVNELGLDADLDFPNGYYIYNKNDQTNSLKVAENVKVYIVNWHDLANQTITDVNGLTERMADYQAPYYLTIKDGVIVEILEQYVP